MEITPDPEFDFDYGNDIDEITNEAIQRSGDNSDQAWRGVCLEAVHQLCKHRHRFTTDDLDDYMKSYHSDVKTHDNRARGSVMRQAARNGWCIPTGEYIASRRKEAHKNPKAVWRSLIHHPTP